LVAHCRSATTGHLGALQQAMTVRLALLAALAPALAPATAHAVAWSAPRSVTVSGTAREPVVALGGPDAAAVAYVRHVGGADRVEVRQGTIQALRAPAIVDRDARHGLDSPALTFSGHVALVAWRRFQDPDTRVLEFASVSRGRVVSGPRSITGPPNSYEPAFPNPGLLTFWRRKAAYARTIEEHRPVASTRLPAGAAFESEVATLPDGTRVAVWPNASAIYAATQAPGALAFGTATRISAPGGFARSPQLAVTPDGHAVAVWTQSDGIGRALVSASRAPGAAFAPPVQLTSRAAQALAVRAIATSAGDVVVTFVSGPPQSGAGPLRALRVAPAGGATPPLTLTPPGERTRGATLAADRGAAYATWVTAGTGRHVVRAVRIAGTIVGTVRTISGADSAVSAPPAFAMTGSGRALLAYATRSNRIRLVTRRAG
jgi:hypothetical protein